MYGLDCLDPLFEFSYKLLVLLESGIDCGSCLCCSLRCPGTLRSGCCGKSSGFLALALLALKLAYLFLAFFDKVLNVRVLCVVDSGTGNADRGAALSLEIYGLAKARSSE